MFECPVCSGLLFERDCGGMFVCEDCGCAFEEAELIKPEDDDYYAHGDYLGDIEREGG